MDAKEVISLPVRSMPEETVVKLLSQFEAIGIRVWIDGGWAVDALLGQQTRPHGDLDIVVQKQDIEQIWDVLKALGYKDVMDADTRPWNFVMADEVGHEIDFHVIEFDEDGNGVYGPPDMGLLYPAASLTGSGVIGGYPVSCISPEWLIRFHTGYEIDEQDVHDVMALHRRFGVPLPDEYIALSGKVRDDRAAALDEQVVKYSVLSRPTEAKEPERRKNVQTKFRHIARAVIVKENQILIAKVKGAHSFLPGGGVELAEGAKSAIRRELQEELGVESCRVGRFLGAMEVFIEEVPNEVLLHEICHLFEVHVDSLEPDVNPPSLESHLEFYWVEFHTESLVRNDVLPKVVQKSLLSLYEGTTHWVSSFES